MMTAHVMAVVRAHHGYTTGAKFGHRTLTREHRTRTGYGSTPASLTRGFAPKPHTLANTNAIQYYLYCMACPGRRSR